ncbi:MAG: class I SAM-dependent methyltransferase [Planctomycetota bacterium]
MGGDRFTAEQREGFAWNRASWNERVEAHWRSRMYQAHADALRAGGHDLEPRLTEAMGDVAGQRLAHLQCHMGMETLGWERLGAEACGLDFSPPAIERACLLRDELGMSTRFVVGNVYDAPQLLGDGFDAVFVSVGSLCWLPDVRRWAEVVATLLNEGGRLLLDDVHPLLNTLDNAPGEPGFAFRYPYLGGDRVVLDEDGTYVDGDHSFENQRSAEWNHSLGDIVTGLIDAGLRVDSLNESAHCVWKALDVMSTEDEQTWQFPEPWRDRIPTLFTLRATRTGPLGVTRPRGSSTGSDPSGDDSRASPRA